MIEGSEQLHIKQFGHGEPLLLLHGLLMNGDMFDPVLESLSKDYRVLAPDLRGFGRSGHLSPPYTIEQHARDLEKLLKSLSIPSAAVLGYSQGGIVAQQLALDYPHLVSHLILCCTFAYNRLTWQEKIEGLLMPWLIQLCSPRQLAQLFKGLSAEQLKQLETMIASQRKPRMVEATQIMLKFDSRHRLIEIKCPTLIVAGETDTAVPLRHARMLAQGIPNTQLVIIPGAGHEMLWTHGTDVIKAVKSFYA